MKRNRGTKVSSLVFSFVLLPFVILFLVKVIKWTSRFTTTDLLSVLDLGVKLGAAAPPLTCRLLLRRRGLHLPFPRMHLDEQSKKLQSSSLLQFWSRMSLIFGSKNAMSTSIATT